MTTQNIVPNPPAQDSKQTKQLHQERERLVPWRRLATRAAFGGAFLFAALVVSLMLSSCGEKDSQSAGDQSGAAVATQQPVAGGSEPSNSAVARVASQDGKHNGGQAAAGPGSVPDVTVELADTLVTPGESIELVAEASADVSEIELWDGLHDKHAFAYDSNAKVWRATYRVPLRTPWERLGLSVTAKNGDHRWRRVWVFLRTERETLEAEPDSVSG